MGLNCSTHVSKGSFHLGSDMKTEQLKVEMNKANGHFIYYLVPLLQTVAANLILGLKEIVEFKHNPYSKFRVQQIHDHHF